MKSDLWEAADWFRAGSKLTSNQCCMPMLGLIFLCYAYSRFKLVEKEILKNRPVCGGQVLPVEANNAMELVEAQLEQLTGVLPKDYTIFSDELLAELLRIFNSSALDEVGGDVIGRIYEYFLNKFAKNIAQDNGGFFTPKSLVKMIVNILEPQGGVLLDPTCGSGGIFVQPGDFVSAAGMEANTFYHDTHNLDSCSDYVMANPSFNVDKVNSESTQSAGRLPFGLLSVNKAKEVGNANYLWISYFYSYLNEEGRAGFVMASSATDSSGKGWWRVAMWT